MNSRNLVNLALLVFVVVAAILIITDSGKEEKKPTIPLTSLKKDAINHITVIRSGKPDIEFAIQNNLWYMLKPYNLPAKSFRIDSLLRLAETPSNARYQLTDAKRYKLDKPQLKVIFNKNLTINFGGSEPLNMQRYVGIGNVLHLITDTQFHALNSDVVDFLDMHPLPSNAKIQKIVLPNMRIELTDGKWQIIPQAENTSADAVAELVTEWQNVQAMEITSLPPSTPTKADIQIILADTATQLQFHIVRKKNEFALIRQDLGLQYVFNKEKEKALLTLPEPVIDNPDTTEQKSGP